LADKEEYSPAIGDVALSLALIGLVATPRKTLPALGEWQMINVL
jgi:hypothetical protein